MRLNTALFLLFLVLYFIAGLSLLITGGVAHAHATQYSNIGGRSIMSGAGFIIALGVFIIILSVLGFLGGYKNRVGLLKIFIGSLALILLLQFIAAIVGFKLRNKADSTLRSALLKSLAVYPTGDADAVSEWNHLQQHWSCCGIDTWEDWTNKTILKAPPNSCCVKNDCSNLEQHPDNRYQQGCYQAVRNLFLRYSKAIGGVSLFFLFVEIAGMISAIMLLRESKNNYGNV